VIAPCKIKVSYAQLRECIDGHALYRKMVVIEQIKSSEKVTTMASYTYFLPSQICRFYFAPGFFDEFHQSLMR